MTSFKNKLNNFYNTYRSDERFKNLNDYDLNEIINEILILFNYEEYLKVQKNYSNYIDMNEKSYAYERYIKFNEINNEMIRYNDIDSYFLSFDDEFYQFPKITLQHTLFNDMNYKESYFEKDQKVYIQQEKIMDEIADEYEDDEQEWDDQEQNEHDYEHDETEETLDWSKIVLDDVDDTYYNPLGE